MQEHKLVEVNGPELYENVFPYDLPLKIIFANKKVDLEGNVSERNLRISDTTFRDGQQARPPYTVEQIVNLFNLLNKISGPNGIIINSFFIYSKKDKDAVIACMEQGHRFPEITGWIKGTLEDGTHLKWLEEIAKISKSSADRYNTYGTVDTAPFINVKDKKQRMLLGYIRRTWQVADEIIGKYS